jgi:hypothetical protein
LLAESPFTTVEFNEEGEREFSLLWHGPEVELAVPQFPCTTACKRAVVPGEYQLTTRRGERHAQRVFEAQADQSVVID